MAKDGQPSDKTRRKFLKDIGTGIVGAYAVVPAVNAKSSNLKTEIIDSLENRSKLTVKVNGKKIQTKISPNMTLAEFLRDNLNLTGTKMVCNQGECGSCTVLLEKKPVYSCHMLALDANGKEVLTIEGLLNENDLGSIQNSFVENDGLQCGFCTPGQIMSGYALLLNNPAAGDEEIIEGLSGNLCRCGAYPKIFDSVKSLTNSKN